MIAQQWILGTCGLNNELQVVGVYDTSAEAQFHCSADNKDYFILPVTVVHYEPELASNRFAAPPSADKFTKGE